MQHFRVLLLLVFFSVTSTTFGQTDPKVVRVDSTLTNPDAKKDSVFAKKKDSVVNLRSANKLEEKPAVVKDSARLALERLSKLSTRRSMIVPGWGQITNKRWWKVPILYAGFVGLGLVIDFNQRNYKELLKELRYNDSVKGDTSKPQWLNPAFANYNYNNIIDAKDYYRRNRDLSFLLIGALYAVNVIDAYVDATFFRFDVSKDLSLKLTPSFNPSYALSSGPSLSPAIKLQLSFRSRKNDNYN
ncbi:DUF5683 domain-containing protein [Desertivirga arenae]|uniref:DUF5683 domain-containing protein n=1 Tax=Desertivirga arenae TaxID=2810309 RepID=UPI001A96B67C|nr:DUF5683 domain-containing protein [Pedobacter sp. SYSU D00823]